MQPLPIRLLPVGVRVMTVRGSAHWSAPSNNRVPAVLKDRSYAFSVKADPPLLHADVIRGLRHHPLEGVGDGGGFSRCWSVRNAVMAVREDARGSDQTDAPCCSFV